MSKKDTRTPEQQDFDERVRRAAAYEERLDETLTRREVIDALEYVAEDYSGQHGSNTRDLLARITKALS